MAELELQAQTKRKKKIIRIASVFIVIMLIMTFFSNTIINFSLPRVEAAVPGNGALIKELTGEGTVRAKESAKIYSDQGRLVEEVKGAAGDKVKKGQVIVVLNKDELERQLAEELLHYDQMKLQMEKLSDSGNLPDEKGSSADSEIEKKNAAEAESNLANMKALYEAGAVSKEELNKAETALLTAKKDYAQKLKSVRDKGRDIKDQQDSIQLEDLKIQDLKKKISLESTLVSPVDGVITEINVEKGDLTNSSVPVFSIADLSKGFEMRVPVEEENAKYLAPGDEVEVTIKSLGQDAIKGAVREIRDSTEERGKKKDLVFELPQTGLKGGEQGEFYIEKRSRGYSLLVPNSAVGTDNKGKFVWVLKERGGLLGNEYFVQQARVKVDDSDSSMTAVLSGITADEKVIIRYSKNLSEGSRVVLG